MSYKFKVLLEWIQFQYDVVTLFVQNNIQKSRTQNMQWKQRYRWKRYHTMTRRNVRHFPPASRRLMSVYDVIGNMVIATSVDARGNSVKKMINLLMAMRCRNKFHDDLWVCTELQILSKTASHLWFYAYKKYKNGNSARHTSTLIVLSQNFAWQLRRSTAILYLKTVFILLAL